MEEQNNPYRNQKQSQKKFGMNPYQNTQNQHTSSSQYTNPGQYNQDRNDYRQNEEYKQNLRYGQYGQQERNNQNLHYKQPGSQQNFQYQEKKDKNKMIKNPEMNIDHGIEMNDRDYLNDILATEKYLTDGFNTFAREASHTELHNDIRNILDETHDCAREIFNLMFKDGFYSFQAASQQEINQTEQKFSKYLSQQDPYQGNMGQ